MLRTNGSVIFARWRQCAPRLIHGCLGTHEYTCMSPSRISIGSAVLLHSPVCPTHTDTQSNHATPTTAVDCAFSLCVRCGLKILRFAFEGRCSNIYIESCECRLSHDAILFIYLLFKHRRQRAEATYMPVKSIQ